MLHLHLSRIDLNVTIDEIARVLHMLEIGRLISIKFHTREKYKFAFVYVEIYKTPRADSFIYQLTTHKFSNIYHSNKKVEDSRLNSWRARICEPFKFFGESRYQKWECGAAAAPVDSFIMNKDDETFGKLNPAVPAFEPTLILAAAEPPKFEFPNPECRVAVPPRNFIEDLPQMIDVLLAQLKQEEPCSPGYKGETHFSYFTYPWGDSLDVYDLNREYDNIMKFVFN